MINGIARQLAESERENQRKFLLIELIFLFSRSPFILVFFPFIAMINQ